MTVLGDLEIRRRIGRESRQVNGGSHGGCTARITAGIGRESWRE